MKLNEIVSKIKNLINKPQEEVEIWKPIKGFEGLYEISNMGRIRGLKSNKIISPTINQVTLSKNGIKKTIKVSRLVIQSFLNDVCSFSHIEHLNNDITDNRLSNLKLFDSKHTKCIQKDIQVLENEVWKDIPSYDGRYQVSNLGRIRSLNHKNPHIITYSIHHKGYLESRLYFHDNGILKMKSHKVHRIVAEAFIPNPENKPCVNHIDGDKTNNKVENLEWVSYKDNTKHAMEVLGHGRRKITTKEAEQIRKNVLLRKYSSLKEIEKEYNISQSVISTILTNRTYKTETSEPIRFIKYKKMKGIR